jgi:hypothetical protein
MCFLSACIQQQRFVLDKSVIGNHLNCSNSLQCCKYLVGLFSLTKINEN